MRSPSGRIAAGDSILSESCETSSGLQRMQGLLRRLSMREAANIMFTLLDEQKAKKFWEDEIRQKAEKRGEKVGEARLSDLIGQLLKSGRNEDALRVTTDEKYRQQMYKQLNIQ